MKRLVRKHDQRLTAEEAEQICRVTILFNLVAISFLGLFALIAFWTGDRQYALILLGVLSLALGGIGLFLHYGHMQQLVLTTCLGYLPFCMFLQISGGQNNSGILWHYVYPIMVYYISGLRFGSLCSSLLIASEIALMQVDGFSFFQAHYSNEFKLRFISSMTVMSIMGAMLEHSRSKAQKSLMLLANRLHKASQTDELTGLPNRRALQQILHDEAVRANRINGDFSIVLCDIDHFKLINDNYGHAVGDEALRQIAGNMHAAIRKSDILARWGGEEFMLVLSETDMACARIMAERMRATVEHSGLTTSEGGEIRLTISCGVANWREHQEIKQLFRAADDRLYRAKSRGRNSVVSSNESHHCADGTHQPPRAGEGCKPFPSQFSR